jgi:hypothetical protein
LLTLGIASDEVLAEFLRVLAQKVAERHSDKTMLGMQTALTERDAMVADAGCTAAVPHESTTAVQASIRIFSASVGLLAAVIFVSRSFDAKRWLDDLFTVNLMAAASLPDLWAAIASGIDANPPLYMTAAWLVVHALPRSVSWVEALTWLNVAFIVAALAVLFRIGRRLVSSPASWMAVFLFAALNDGAIYLALALRTYALFFLMTTACILFQQRLMENHRRVDLVLLGILYCLLAMAHTFGIVYVLCIGLSAFISTAGNDRAAAKLSLLAMVPAVLAFACWLPVLVMQMDVSKPYSWMPRPGIIELVRSAFPSPLSVVVALAEIACLAGFLPWYLRSRSAGSRVGNLRWLATDRSSQPFRFACLLLLSISLFAIFAWTISRTVLPFFLARYFTPSLIISFALNLALCEFLVELCKRDISQPQPKILVGMLAIACPALLAVTLLYKTPAIPHIPCTDGTGAFFEDRFVRDGVPIVVESPHVWFPRMYYSQHRSLYRFPLDWDVVLKFPGRPTNNATDFNIMQRFKRFAGEPGIRPTEDIVRDYPQFLVVSESNRAWFHNLSNVRRVTADKLAETMDDLEGNSCTLWHVKNVQDRP